MDGRTEVESVASVAVESSCVTVTVPVADEIPTETGGFGGGEVEGVKESCNEGNKEEIMVGIVGSDVFVDVVSDNHDGLEEDSEVFVHLVSGNHGTCIDTEFVGSDAAVEENIGFKNTGGGDEILGQERNHTVSEERKGEVAAEVELGPDSNAKTSIVVMTTEVELREEIEDGGVVDAVRDEVRSLIDDKEVLTELETAKEEISYVGRSSHGGVSEEEAWNPGIVSVSASCSVMLETDSVQHEIIREESVAMLDNLIIAHEVSETSEVSVRDNANETSTYPLMIETDEGKQQEVATVPQESTLRFKDEIPSVHEMAETCSEVFVLDKENHTSTACPMMLETDGVQQEEAGAMVEEINSASIDEIPVAHEIMETASDHTSASCSQTFVTDDLQQEKGPAMVEESNLSSKDESPVVHEMMEIATELSVPDNTDHTSASCSLMLELHQEEGAAMEEESNLSSRDVIPVAEHSVTDNTDYASASCSLMFESDGGHHEIITEENVVVLEVNNSTCKDDIVVVDVGSEPSVPDDANLETDGVQNEVVKEESFPMLQEKDSSFKDKIPGVHETNETAFKVANISQVIDANGTHDNANGDSVSSFHHDASDEPEQVMEKEVVQERPVEFDIIPDNDNHMICSVENDLSMKQKVSCGNVGGEDDPPELTYENLSDVDIVIDFDDVVDVKDEETDDLDAPMEEICCTGKTNDICTVPMTGDKELEQSDLSMLEVHEQVVDTGNTEALAPKEDEDVRELSYGSKIPQEIKKLDTSGTDLAVEGSVSSKTEKEDELLQANQINAHECHSDGKVFAEETFGSPNSHVRSKKEDEIHQANHIIGQELHGNEELCAEGASGLPNSQVECKKEDEIPQENHITGHELHGNEEVCVEGASGLPTCHVGFIDEGNNDNVFPDESQKLNISADIQENETNEMSICEVASSAGGTSQVIEREDEDHKTMAIAEDASEMGKSEILEEGKTQSLQTVGVEIHTSKSDRAKVVKERKIKPSSLMSVHQSGYFGPIETDGEFSVSDLVWGKVRSHPWWPGQIFDPSDASDRAVRYIKKDAYLVAYFGDRTFAWNDASVLKPLRPHFSQIVKQRNSEVLQIAIDSALEEVSRRVKLGLSCSCTPKDVYKEIECQIVENAGIREESSRRYGVDETSKADLFEPDKLLEHIRALALSPLNLCDKLELAIAEGQLSSFCHFKGYRPLPLFESRETSFEDVPGTDCEIIDVKVGSMKDDSLQQPKKERSLSELMIIHTEFFPDDDDVMDDDEVLSKSMGVSLGKKRKAVDSVGDDSSAKRVSIYAAKLSTTSSSPKTPSFKVGDCIRRVATQLTGASSSLKASNGQSHEENVMFSPESSSSSTSGDMLTQLQLLARDPKKRYGLLKNIGVFLSDFRNSIVSKHAVGGKRKRKTCNPVGNSTTEEFEFEFEDVNDSYWKDKAIENYHDEKLLQEEVVSPPAKVNKPTRRPYTRKKHSTENNEPLVDEPMEEEEDQSIMKRGTSPAELIMNFVKGSRIPSQISLNNMFRRFGSLKECETEVDQDTCRARVVFKKGADAEVAYSSAVTFNIFGSMQVTYQLSYSPTSSTPLLISQGQEVGT